MKQITFLLAIFIITIAAVLSIHIYYDRDRDCDDFESWSEAQDFYERTMEKHGEDIHRLDRNKNGIACEHLND